MKQVHKGIKLDPINEKWIMERKPDEIITLARPLLLLLAQIADASLVDGVTWASFGTTRKGDAIRFSIYQEAGPIEIYSPSLEKLLAGVPDLL